MVSFPFLCWEGLFLMKLGRLGNAMQGLFRFKPLSPPLPFLVEEKRIYERLETIPKMNAR